MTDQAREHYEREGYAIYHRVLDADLIQEASEHVDWLLQKNPGRAAAQQPHDQ